MHAITINWLIKVAEEFKLKPETLHLTVNYMDRYLSRKKVKCSQHQLLRATCMLVASKYEESCAPEVQVFCDMTANTYSKEEALHMEADVWKHLRYELAAPTVKCFLRGLVHVAHGTPQTDFLVDYISELSLLEHNMLCLSPSTIAAASVFLANFILRPTEHAWNVELANYLQYQPHQLRKCVKDLVRLFYYGHATNLPAIRNKYSTSKYMFAALIVAPSA